MSKTCLSKNEAIGILRGEHEVGTDELLPIKKGYSPYVTYSRNVFVPLTRLCRNKCGYCTFRREPSSEDNIMRKEDVMKLVNNAGALNCSEVLFTFGEKPEVYSEARIELEKMGYDSILEYLYDLSEHIAHKTQLLVHSNPGVMEKKEIEMLRPVTASMGLMLENISKRLMNTIAHANSPGKDPELRLRTIRNAGKLRVPFTTGLLIGIGENDVETYESLIEIRKLHDRYGHIQEIIIQNFIPKMGTPMGSMEPVSLENITNVIKLARILFPDVALQIPPNLNIGNIGHFIDHGIDDLGGISPLTPDFINPENPWPLNIGSKYLLKERLPVYPKYINKDFLSTVNYKKAITKTDAEGYVRMMPYEV